jgi:(1->4)-alpha-D-glucan 1-alpha-D-glucosylmutase
VRNPVSTYRLQIHNDFTLDDATDQLDYLSRLGVDWVYLSPILSAFGGSEHGYDMVDPSSVDAARGGPEALTRLADRAHSLGMGVLVDIVPNHMGIADPRQNPWWWSVLRDGRDSPHAEAFDIDWEFGGGRVRLPVLGDDSTVSVIDDELDVDGTRYPLRPGSTDAADLDELLARQHYELIHWRRADAELNYRRFFAITTLAGLRVEVPAVFERSHAEIARWCTEGLVDGLRVDHPDGLLDPGRYLDDLARVTGGTFVLVEKILEGRETLPPHWAVAGTTGYDALADVDRVLVDPAARQRIRASLGDGRGQSWSELIHRTRRDIADGILRSEILRIARLIADEPDAADAIAEITACFPVYRTYLPFGAEHLAIALDEAARRRPDLGGTLERLAPVLGDPEHPAAQRLQQTTGMVMAKGVEDTAFYRYSGLVSLTEVGGDPSEFSIDVDEFHARQGQRQGYLPASMTTLTTHDTKRGEDVRARIHVIAELPEVWGQFLASVRERVGLGMPAFENLLWESIVGAWPASRDRLREYARKAAREAGVATSWTDPDVAFESALDHVVDAAFDDTVVGELVAQIVDRVAPAGWSNAVAAKLLQLTAPGVPDVYQGTELWESSLVDPDNRRPVDFAARRDALDRIDARAVVELDDTGAAKLLVASRALRLRRDHPELFTRYAALTATGDQADHVIAFDRGGAVTVATRLPVGLAAAGRWGDTAVLLPHRPVTDVLTGADYEGGSLPLARLLQRYPVALLAPTDR